jgi:trimeric autotransporter adhesin
MLLVASVSLTVLASGVALAALSDVPDPDTVGVNGRVWDILVAGDTIYLAGAFTQITDEVGSTFQRNNLAAVDAATGQVTSWNPSAINPNNPSNSSVRSMALSSDGTRLFVGGTFTRVGGLARSRLAAVDPVTGAVDNDWKGTGTNNVVRALAVSGERLYLGGDFTQVMGEPRQHLAAVDTETATLDSVWKPTATKPDGTNSNVYAMDVSADGTRVYVGGSSTPSPSTTSLLARRSWPPWTPPRAPSIPSSSPPRLTTLSPWTSPGATCTWARGIPWRA